MSKNIEVTPELLESTATSIEGLAGDYKTQYENLYKETNAMASSWSGKDNTAFVNQIEGFKDDLKKMYELMLKYAEFLRNSAKAYRDQQDHIAEGARKLQN